ncbi:hypothetical protein HYH02_004700 [Chlamydomonas schloesseri]|uniref:Protein kinase domain-containing protein n=1 Tax=Chlamydomonas schloesseri TaxID=2026947 RepID=A0A835WNE0_9CHLO|nr:hypothetical protein HYH02_004700 [Chlamydomonas schloesseri]|eukprot:KAG2450867.1 hypothetical protein HYH02_004700 [Chlamydomonas schloesseri]
MSVERSGKSATNNLQIVDEFQDDDEYEEEAGEAGEAPGEDGTDSAKAGKLAGWFKSLFKKEKAGKSSSKRSSTSSSRNASTTQLAPQKAPSPASSKPTSPSGEALRSPTPPAHPPPPASFRSKSQHSLAQASANGTSATSPRFAPGKVSPTGEPQEPSTPTTNAAPAAGGDAVLVSPASRSKSMSLKSELNRLRQSPLQHSKSFTELSQKARIIPKRGNEVLIVSPSAPPRMQRTEWSLRDYAVVEKMYKGYASSVYKAFCKRSGELVCLKAYDMAALCELNRFQIYREVQLHGKLAHANVIGLYGAFQVDSQVVMVQEFADGGDLFTLLHRYGGRMPERQAVEMVLQPCLKVLMYLHEQGILHRDLKPENILFARNMTFKLCDFGLAIDLRDERAVTRAGTLEYMAPEVLECPFKSRPIDNKENERLHYTAAVDSWAVGVLAYELLVGRPPFEAPEREGVEECIRKQVPRYPFGLSELARSFIATALQKDPEQRPTVQEMLSHPFIAGAKPAPAPRAATVVATAAAHPQQLLRPAGSAINAAAAASAVAQATSPGGAAAAAASALPAVSPKGGAAKAASRAIAAAGGMDDDDLGVGAMANRMKSYTAGKAIAISHQALQANRHVHLPHVEHDNNTRAAVAAAAAGGAAGGAGASASGSVHPHPPGSIHRDRPISPLAAEALQQQQGGGPPKLAALNPKLAATLGVGAPGGMVGRTVSVSRIM